MIQDGEFREDLYYRLNGITLHLPLLRDRSDKADLIRTLLQEENTDQESIEIAEDAFQKLLDYSWPGNIRQLRNALRTASALCRDGIIRLSNLPQEILHTETRAIAPPSVEGSVGGRRGGAEFAVRRLARCRMRGPAARTRKNALEYQPHRAGARASAATRCTARFTSTTSCSSNSREE